MLESPKNKKRGTCDVFVDTSHLPNQKNEEKKCRAFSKGCYTHCSKKAGSATATAFCQAHSAIFGRVWVQTYWNKLDSQVSI